MENKGTSSWTGLMRNPHGTLLRRNFQPILKNEYYKYDEILERLGLALATERDLQEFINFVSEIYKAGFIRAVADQESQFKKLGYDVNMVMPSNVVQTSQPQIFKECEQQNYQELPKNTMIFK